MARISLVVSDVDGSLVTSDKRLTEASRNAVHRLHQAGIAFTIVSSRPPFGLRMLVEPLALKLPIGAFNGGVIANPDLTLLDQHLVPGDAAQTSLRVLTKFGAEIWVFTADAWCLLDPSSAHVQRERRTVQWEPTVVSDLTPALAHAAKIVGVSSDYERLAACEEILREALSDRASAARSQPYYLDVTAPRVNKGTFVEALCQTLGVPREEIATIGDMENDIAMFRRSGLAIAMGNAPPAVKGAAYATTETNDADGFAVAVERFVLTPAAQPRRSD